MSGFYSLSVATPSGGGLHKVGLSALWWKRISSGEVGLPMVGLVLQQWSWQSSGALAIDVPQILVLSAPA